MLFTKIRNHYRGAGRKRGLENRKIDFNEGPAWGQWALEIDRDLRNSSFVFDCLKTRQLDLVQTESIQRDSLQRQKQRNYHFTVIFPILVTECDTCDHLEVLDFDGANWIWSRQTVSNVDFPYCSDRMWHLRPPGSEVFRWIHVDLFENSENSLVPEASRRQQLLVTLYWTKSSKLLFYHHSTLCRDQMWHLRPAGSDGFRWSQLDLVENGENSRYPTNWPSKTAMFSNLIVTFHSQNRETIISRWFSLL